MEIEKYIIQVDKKGSINHYLNLPVIINEKVIGTITDVREYKDTFQLTICIWKRSVKFEVEFNAISQIPCGIIMQ